MKSSATASFSLDPKLAADSHPLTRLALCDLRLMDDSHYPWLLLIPRIAGARELLDLDSDQRHRLSDEIDFTSRVLREAFRPFKLNVAALGNVVSQLHVHVIARFEDDPAWPTPIWGKVESRPYTPEELVKRTAVLEPFLKT